MLTDDEAVVKMVDANSQREELLPSEKAFAYKMKMDAMRRQGVRSYSTSDQNGPKLSSWTIGEENGISGTQVKRFIRLTELIPELLRMVDDRKIALTPAVEISYLTKEEQEILFMTIDCEMATPSLSQAQRMKQISREGKLTDDMILQIMSEKKKPECWNLVFPMNKVSKYFPKSYTPKRMEETIYGLLEGWRNDQSRREKNIIFLGVLGFII